MFAGSLLQTCVFISAEGFLTGYLMAETIQSVSTWYNLFNVFSLAWDFGFYILLSAPNSHNSFFKTSENLIL